MRNQYKYKFTIVPDEDTEITVVGSDMTDALKKLEECSNYTQYFSVKIEQIYNAN